jgi:hypothetical protein
MAGGSGNKRMRINTLERSVSNDYNRGWSFLAAWFADTLYNMYTGPGHEITTGGGIQKLTGVAGPIATPAEAAVLGGLMVIAPTGSTELAVQPGAAIFVDPDGLVGSSEATAQDADDAVAKLVVDNDGILAGSGSLALTANVSGSVRVDLVEIRRDPATIETTSRDIYNTTTGQFTSTLVTKVDGADSFEYRIRLGTPAAGIPALAQGWLPICVIGVPNGAVDFDVCTLYDVRPLVRERVNAYTVGEDLNPQDVKCDLVCDVISDGAYDGSGAVWGENRMSGVYQNTLNGYRIGGVLSSVVGGVDVDYIDLRDAGWQSSGFTFVDQEVRFMWLLFPAGLPRWVRYSRANVAPFGGRVPQAHRGIFALSNVVPANTSGKIAAAGISIPANAGLDTATTTTNAVAVHAVPIETTTVAKVWPFIVVNRRLSIWWDNGGVPVGNFASSFVATATAADRDFYDITIGIAPQNAPPLAKELLVRASASLQAGAGTEGAGAAPSLASGHSGTAGAALGWWYKEITGDGGQHQLRYFSTAGNTSANLVRGWVSIQPNVPDVLSPTFAKVIVNWGLVSLTKTGGENLSIHGWMI